MSNKSTTEFLLARHGETEWNRIRRLQGRLDSPLSQAGQSQALTLAESMQNCGVDLILSSPLGRARETAKVCQEVLTLDLHLDEGLQERHFGQWQSQYFDELSHHDNFEAVFFQVTDRAPPGGESGVECGDRISKVLCSIANSFQQRKFLIVTHGDAIRCFLASLSQQGECDAYSQYGNGRVFPVNYCHQKNEFSVLE